MQVFIEDILYNYSYLELFAVAFGYFLILYFGLAPLFLLTCQFLARKNLLNKIESKDPTPKQVQYEIIQSSKSIIVFGFSILPIVYLIRIGFISQLPDTWFNILWGVIVLTLWNEVHFFIVHRIMHLKLFMKHFHYIHHKSVVPTVYSVYSFHWFEALLLSTVPLSIMIFIPFSIIAVFIYPLVSILLNYAGHCNYRFGNGQGDGWILFGTYHNQHHSRGKKNYGFALNFLDKLISRLG